MSHIPLKTSESQLFPACGDREFWLDFNSAYLNQRKLDLTVARQVAVFALRQRKPGATPPSIYQVRKYVKSLPPEIVTFARTGEYPSQPAQIKTS